MFYYLYEIRNNLNGKIYVGVHKTINMDDGYMGSGKVIKRAIEKHGVDNFTKFIIESFENSKSMYVREKEVVTDEFLERDNVYNLRRGGTGGFDYINNFGLNGHVAAVDSKLSKLTDDVYRNALSTIMSNAQKKSYNSSMRSCSGAALMTDIMSERARSERSVEKRVKTFDAICHQQGVSNSQYGTMWITNGVDNKKIKKHMPIPDGWEKGRK